MLNTASKERLPIIYKLPNTSISKNKICILQSFVMVKDLAQAILLGNPYIYNLFPIDKIDRDRITTSKFGETITFRFIDEPSRKYLNQLKNNCLLK